MFRFSLGKITTGSDLVTAQFPSGGTFSTALVPGKYYRIEFDKTGTGLMYITVGELKTNKLKGRDGAISIDRFCASGNELKLEQADVPTTYANVTCYELAWNSPLANEPKGWDDLKIKTARDKTLNGLFTQYTTELTFWGDGYTYLKGILDTEGFCSEVPILIEERCSELDEWETFFEGSISIPEVEFDLYNCTAKTAIKDRGAIQTISKGKNVKVAFDEGSTILSVDYDNKGLYLHDAAGTYPGGVNSYLIAGSTVYGMFKYIIAQISDGGILFESDYFSSTDFANLFIFPIGALTIGHPTYSRAYDLPYLSFDDIFTGLDKYHNLSFSLDYNGNIPTLRVEPKTYFENATPVISLTNVPGIKFKINNDNLYRTVTVGNKTTARGEEKGVQYHSEFGCAGNDLNLLSDWIVDSDIILGILAQSAAYNPSDYESDLFLIEAEPKPASSDAQSRIYGTNTYNGLLTPAYSMERRINSLNADMYISSDRTDIQTKTNDVKIKEYEFVYPLTKAQFALITNPSQSVEFSGGGLDATTYGFVQEVEYNKKTGKAKFKLLGV